MDRTELEHAVRTAKPDLDDFFENAVVAMHLVGPDGTILRANRAELALLGYEYAEFLARLSRGEKVDKYPARLRAKDGGIKHVLISSSAQFRDGHFVNTRCISLDVTNAHEAEAALRERERHYRELLGSLPRCRLHDRCRRADQLLQRGSCGALGMPAGARQVRVLRVMAAILA